MTSSAGTFSCSAADYAQRPLACLDGAFQGHRDAFWIPHRQLIVAEPEAARSILKNSQGLYAEHSDFFHGAGGALGSRDRQIAMGRALRSQLNLALENRDGMAETTRRRLAEADSWPDAGNWLIYDLLVAALVGKVDTAERRLLRQIIERAVLAGARQRYGWWSRRRFRGRVHQTLGRAIVRRRATDTSPPSDLFDALIAAAGPDLSPEAIIEVFLAVVFATVGSIGFTLSWSLYLLGTQPRNEAQPLWVVKEALRLWPIAWMLARRPVAPHRLLGHDVSPRDHVVVCPYLVHRHPEHWSDALAFKPQRWAGATPTKAFIPFGWGPHSCVAATLCLGLIEDILSVALEDRYPLVTTRQSSPQVSAALAPPKFLLKFEPRRASVTVRRSVDLSTPPIPPRHDEGLGPLGPPITPTATKGGECYG